MTDKSQPHVYTLPENLSLGKQVSYEEHYNPALLQAVPRALNRDALNLKAGILPFTGADIWTGYELSWLLPSGKPQVAIMECSVPADSVNLVESKSFKLYLNSYNQTQFADVESVRQTLLRDLSACAGKQVDVRIYMPSEFDQLKMVEFDATVIDDIDVEISSYQPDKHLLAVAKDEEVEETLVSHLLKSNCLITSQPDWGTVLIKYQGAAIDHASLLTYIIGFRQHNEFHEQCVERIYCDIIQMCKPKKLTVFARYTRRGGLDINPFRSNFESPYTNHRLARQ